MPVKRTIAQILQAQVLSGRSSATHLWLYIYGNLELENRGHTDGLRSWTSALGRRLRVQVPGHGSFSPVATFQLCS